MDGLALATVFTINAKRILADWEYPILLIRAKNPNERSIAETPNPRLRHQDTHLSGKNQGSIDYYLEPDSVVLPLCKSTRNLRAEIIFGRSDSCDVCLADKTISKEHGCFIPPVKSASGIIGAWNFVDNSSTNGTSINRHKVLPQRPTLLRYGDEIIAGNIQMMFLSKEIIFDLIEYMQNEGDKTMRIPQGAY